MMLARLALLLGLAACGAEAKGEAWRELLLDGPAAASGSELSGLAWHGDHLLLLAENPSDGLYLLPRDEIVARVDETSPAPLRPLQVPFTNPEALLGLPHFDGLEAIVVDGDTVYLLIETRNRCAMEAVLMRGAFTADGGQVEVDAASSVRLDLAHQVCNLSAETMLLHHGHVHVIEEANGAALVKSPVARRFDTGLKPLDAIRFPALDYRVTDATSPDAGGRFWVINYLWPPERRLLMPQDGAADPAAPVEQLLELEVSDEGIRRTESPAVDLRAGLPDDSDAYNWEGLARLDEKGFLAVTDTHPRTVLAFIPFPAP
ncbi:MAG: hypothetical protein RLZZ303_2473 [Candidatus Hydrogenedentota bacterium]|jgi:hypothetical protein